MNLQTQINELETECRKLEQRVLDLDTIQNTMKLFCNSLYGVFAQKFSPLYDIDASGSITLTGQHTIKEAAEIAFKHAKENGFNGKKEDIYLYSDTDSIFVSLTPLTNYKESLLEESGELSPTIKEKVLAFDEHLNTEIKRWAQKELNSADPRLVFKREAICDKAVFMEKKRYILHVINQEDVPSNYFKYVGVEIARSTMSKEVKELVKAVLENAILNGDRKTANAIYQKAYADYQNLPIEAQAFRSKISDLEKQELKRGEHGEIGKHTPSHAKSAIYYNDFLKKLQIDTKYPAIGSGIKMKWFYAAKNPYNLKNMGFIDVYPPEVAAHVQPDTQKMFDKSVAPPITRLYGCLGWNITNPGHETTVDLFELFA
jgi:DNA polymerase elongation subunit (family B)